MISQTSDPKENKAESFGREAANVKEYAIWKLSKLL
jgi:hypothetical protein